MVFYRYVYVWLLFFFVIQSKAMFLKKLMSSNPKKKFFNAVNKGDLDKIKKASKNIKDCNIKNKRGDAAIHIASRKGCLDIVKYLIEDKQVKYKEKNDNNLLPIDLAALENKNKVIAYLGDKYKRDDSSGKSLQETFVPQRMGVYVIATATTLKRGKINIELLPYIIKNNNLKKDEIKKLLLGVVFTKEFFQNYELLCLILKNMNSDEAEDLFRATLSDKVFDFPEAISVILTSDEALYSEGVIHRLIKNELKEEDLKNIFIKFLLDMFLINKQKVIKSVHGHDIRVPLFIEKYVKNRKLFIHNLVNKYVVFRILAASVSVDCAASIMEFSSYYWDKLPKKKKFFKK